MAIADDIDFNYIDKIIRRKSGAGATVYSVNALYSYIQDVFDELAQLDDQVAMSAQTPTSYTVIDAWYIQEELTKYLNGGAIQTNGYNTKIRTLICGVAGWTPFISGDVGNTITGSVTNDTGEILDYDNTAYKIWIRMDDAGDLFDNATENYTQAGTGAGTATAISTTGETIFANPYTLGTLEGTPQLYIYQASSRISEWWSTGHFDVLIKISESGVDIDSKQITVFGRHWTDEYTTFAITLTTAGQNAIPLGTKDDLNNQSTEGDVEDLQDGTTATIAINYSFAAPYSYDIGDGAGAQDYEVQIDCDNRRLTDVYEVVKFWTRTGCAKLLTTGSDGATLKGESYRYAKNTYAEVVVSPLGTFAGGKFFGARSVYFTNMHTDDIKAFQLIDKAGVTRDPPSYQSFLITACVAGDRVAIFPETGGDVNKTQYGIKGAQGAGVAYVDVGIAIPNDTPTSGTLIVKESTTGAEEVLAYTSWSGDRFTLSGVTANAYDAADHVYVPYIYEQATGTSITKTVVYVSDRTVIMRLRKKGILPFETTGTFSNVGYSVAAIRTSDNIVT